LQEDEMKSALTNNFEKTLLVTNHLRKSLTIGVIKSFAGAIDQSVFHYDIFGRSPGEMQTKRIQLNLLNRFLKVIY